MQDQQQSRVQIGPYTFNNKYCIGQGAFGKVYKGKHSLTNKIVAIKELERTMVTEQEINKEISILKQLEHPNIVKYEDALQCQDYFYIITEFCNGGDLRNLLQDSDSDEEPDEQKRVEKLIDMFFQVCQGFEYLRKFNIIHRDLKPSNILIHNGAYKIADFGVARTEELHKSLIHNDMVGVPIYMSPQILSKNFYSYKCDVWSMGIVMYEFYFQKQPWKATDVSGLFFQIMEHPTPYLEQGVQIPQILKSIFENTLQYLEKQRMTWGELLALQRGRKKIFNDFTRSKSNFERTSSEKDMSNSLGGINSNIPIHEAELVGHIYSQSRSLSAELNRLLGAECFSSFLNTLKRYMQEGIEYRQCFIDCNFFVLKIAGENLHLYMMDLDNLEEARYLLVLLQLIHDVSTQREVHEVESFKRTIASSLRSKRIEEYAASVISKINTYSLRSARE